MIQIEGLSKSFNGKRVLRDFSLEIREGERVVLLGRSGCGKTTLLRCIAGFEQPDAGTITIQGRVVNTLPVEQRPVGFIFQNHALFPHKTVYDNIAVGPRVRGEPEADIAKKIDGLLAIMRISDLRHAWPNQLSGGECQRVALARAVINRPQVLLLDEPLSALDETLRQDLREELVEMQKTFGITFLFVTHDQEEAMTLADRMSILEDGQLLQVGEPEQLYDRPANRFVAGFLGEVNRLPGVVEEGTASGYRVALEGGGVVQGCTGLRLEPGAAVEVFIRPERMGLAAQSYKEEDWNVLAGTIERRLFFGCHTQYRVRVSNGRTVIVLAPHGTDTGFEPGMAVFVPFSVADTLLYTAEGGEAADA